MNLTAYLGERSLEQYLPIPRITQIRNAGHAGGVIDFTRYYAGTDVYLQHDFTDNFNVITGLAFDYMQDKRKGYENFNGTINEVKGALRRDETNKIYNIEPYVQTQWAFLPNWVFTVACDTARLHLNRRITIYATAMTAGAKKMKNGCQVSG
ncbi:hypothetical protein [Rodentibacter caecimuris]|uniref:hypothetical protein n=1 Tax=Rodentibacter caecimuris TaxID=1796644 RepID=UPI0007509573|nr:MULTISPECIES: hypothetical protein [Pasteurellaceae]AOF54105.1 putative tonB-dependent receptor yncD precursor [Pasteurellaceae bacterium NI1060]MCR1836693.1 hypothetical protein [Pasteurella caecimuris]MCU0106091.1 hypothetical protein [Pasteurella caecimuris]